MASSVQPKLPKNYQLIYEIVQASGIGRHLTPSDIFAKAHKRRPGIGFSTVYRGLERLRELGLISELYVPGVDAATYEPVGTAACALSLQRLRRDRRRCVCDSTAHAQDARAAARFHDCERTRDVRRPLRDLRYLNEALSASFLR